MNYKQVIKDFNSGVLDRKKVTLVMDNDGGYWSVKHKDLCVAEYKEKQLAEKYGIPGGYNDIVDVLEAAGVHTEWC